MLFLKISQNEHEQIERVIKIKKSKKNLHLETTSVIEILENRHIYEKYRDYYWQEYFELAKQRSDHWEEIGGQSTHGMLDLFEISSLPGRLFGKPGLKYFF